MSVKRHQSTPPVSVPAMGAADYEAFVRRIEPLAGSRDAARAWLKTYPIPAFGGLTGDGLLQAGRGDALEAYLAGIEAGGYA